jgi:hypothetical protein
MKTIGDPRGRERDIGMNAVLTATLRRQPLAACLSVALALGAGSGMAATRSVASPDAHVPPVRSTAPSVTVDNCDDDGPGSLRAVIASAANGETIDLSALTCATISLSTGFIVVAQDDLTLLGPGADILAIDAGAASGVLRHTGSGTLTIAGLAIGNARYESATTPRGGCLYSAANLSLSGVEVSYCAAVGTAGAIALGGAIYARGDLSLVGSTVSNSNAQGMAAGARGGGVYVAGNLDTQLSTITLNQAFGAPINSGRAGGALVLGTTALKSTTVSYNGAYDTGGVYTFGDVTIDSSSFYANNASHAAGLFAVDGGSGATATIVNSTVAGNHASATVGGLVITVPATISSSTIAFNSAHNALGGVLASGPTVSLNSTIIANNVVGDVPDDVDIYGPVVITGAHNLIIASTSATLPPDTIQDDPLLGVIGDHGGPTWTFPLLDGSPAIDAGNNEVHAANDQRGLGFARVAFGAADIGAYEVQDPDVIFLDGFDPP